MGVIALYSLPSFAGITNYFTEVKSTTYSESTSIDSFLHDLRRKSIKGNVAFTHNRLLSGITFSHHKHLFELAYLYRYHYFLRYDEDTFELIKRVNNDLALPNKRFDIKLNTQHLRAKGLYIAHLFDWHDIHWKTSLSLLEADRLLDAKLNGLVTIENGEYQGSINATQYYDEDKLLDRRVKSPTGYGVAMGLSLNGHINTSWSYDLHIDDLFSNIQWKKSPHTEATFITSLPVLDDNGDIIKPSAASGVETFKQYQQPLPIRTTAQLNYHWQEQNLGAELYLDKYFHELTISYSFYTKSANGIKITPNYAIKTQAFGIAFQQDYYLVEITTDQLSSTQSKYLGISLAFKIPLT